MHYTQAFFRATLLVLSMAVCAQSAWASRSVSLVTDADPAACASQLIVFVADVEFSAAVV